MTDYFLAFVPMFVAVDALGMLPFFISLTEGMNPAKRKELIIHSTGTALAVALLFLATGKFVFEWLGVTISDFMIAGGAVLFIISIRDLLVYEKRIVAAAPGVVPLAVPLIVGPAVLATSLILLNSYGVVPTVVSVMLNIFLCGGVLLFAEKMSRLIGTTGSHTLSKISSLLLAAIGVMLIRRGIGDSILTWTQKLQ